MQTAAFDSCRCTEAGFYSYNSISSSHASRLRVCQSNSNTLSPVYPAANRSYCGFEMWFVCSNRYPRILDSFNNSKYRSERHNELAKRFKMWHISSPFRSVESPNANCTYEPPVFLTSQSSALLQMVNSLAVITLPHLFPNQSRHHTPDPLFPNNRILGLLQSSRIIVIDTVKGWRDRGFLGQKRSRLGSGCHGKVIGRIQSDIEGVEQDN